MLALFNLLPPSLYLDPALPPHASPPEPLFHPAVPFEIHVLISTLPGLQGDHALAVESLGDLLRGVKMEMWGARRRGDAEQESVWRERAERVGGITAGVLVEMKVRSSLRFARPVKATDAEFCAGTRGCQHPPSIISDLSDVPSSPVVAMPASSCDWRPRFLLADRGLVDGPSCCDGREEAKESSSTWKGWQGRMGRS